MSIKVKRDPRWNRLELQKGGGCVGAIGLAFALWIAALGSGLILAWRAGDIPIVVLVGGGMLHVIFILGGSCSCKPY